MNQTQPAELTEICALFTRLLYGSLASSKLSRQLADERRLKSLIYVPHDVQGVMLLSVEVQLPRGMRYKLQKQVELVGSRWDLDPHDLARRAFQVILGLLESNRTNLSRRSALLREIASNIGASDLSDLELLSVDFLPTDLDSISDVLPDFAVHLICLAEDQNGNVGTEAIFWQVHDAQDWAKVFDRDIHPEQLKLGLKSLIGIPSPHL